MIRACLERLLGGVLLSMVLSCAATPIRQTILPIGTHNRPVVARPAAAPQPMAASSTTEVEQTPAPESSRQFTVLVARLAGDRDRELERTILGELQAASKELRILAGDAMLPITASKASHIDVSEPAQRAMSEQGADLVIWGEATKNHPRLFIAKSHARSDSTSHLLTGSSDVSQFELPGAYQKSLGELVQLVVLAEAAEFDAERYPIGVLRPIVERVRGLLDTPFFAAKQRRNVRDATRFSAGRWSVLLAYGGALQTLGTMAGDDALIEESIQRYEQALAGASRRKSAERWATTENHLGNAVRLLGEREVGTRRLEAAVGIHRAALKARDRDRVPLDWASSQNNLGVALNALGEREAGTKRLEESVAALREALRVYTRDQAPFQWATIQHNLGNALMALGKRATGSGQLEEAVVALRQALSERSRDREPSRWAATQNSLGNALSELGERETGTQRIGEAVSAYREALKAYTRNRMRPEWAAAQTNLGMALTALGKRERSTARLTEAVGVYRDGLKVCTRERVPLQWAAIQNGLGSALQVLAERGNDPAQLEQAVVALREALKESTRERAPLQWALIRNNLGTALRLLAQREGQPPCDAVENHFEALLMLEPLAPSYAVGAERGLAADLGAEIAPTPTSCYNLEMLWPQVQARGLAPFDAPEQAEAQR